MTSEGSSWPRCGPPTEAADQTEADHAQLLAVVKPRGLPVIEGALDNVDSAFRP